ncbi:MAG: MurR/RpiR family transcriptional regulator, partial [Traorella sp.]
MTIYLRIKNNYDSFTKSEKKVARYCLDNFLNIGEYTLNELSKNAHCGDATIFRFCKKINFDSFNDFKKEVQNEIADSNRTNKESFVHDVYRNIQTVLEFSIQNINHEQLEEICSLIYNSKMIFCAGVGNSGIPAEAC